MAKKKPSTTTKPKLPSVEESVAVEVPAAPVTAKMAFAKLEVPLSPITPTGYSTPRVDIRRMTELQRNNLKRVCRGLNDSGATLKDGKAVCDPHHAIRWMLEQMGE